MHIRPLRTLLYSMKPDDIVVIAMKGCNLACIELYRVDVFIYRRDGYLRPQCDANHVSPSQPLITLNKHTSFYRSLHSGGIKTCEFSSCQRASVFALFTAGTRARNTACCCGRHAPPGRQAPPFVCCLTPPLTPSALLFNLGCKYSGVGDAAVGNHLGKVRIMARAGELTSLFRWICRSFGGTVAV